MSNWTIRLLPCALLATVGCSFHARGPEKYRDDVRAVLETRNAQVQQCYDTALKQQPNLQGTVTVRFVVQTETGNIVDPAVVPEASNAPPELGTCVVNAINGLQLTPPDQREGHATFAYEFSVAPANPPAS